MSTEIKSSGPPIPPPRHDKKYYESKLNENLKTQKVVKPPKAPKRISSKFSANFDKNNIFKNNEHNIVEKNSSANTLSDNKDYDTDSLENEIMNGLNQLSDDHYKFSEDKLTLYEEENERGTESLVTESNVVKSLSSLTINNENNVREIKVEDIPSDSDSFKSIPDSGKGSPISIERKTVESQPSSINQSSLPQSPVQQEEIIENKEVKVESEHEDHEHHKKIKSTKSKSSKSKSKSKSSKSKEEKKRKEEKRRTKKSTESEDVNHKESKHKSKSKSKSKSKNKSKNENENEEVKEKEKEKEYENENDNENENENDENENNEVENKKITEGEETVEKEIDLLREKEKKQREFVIKEQEKLGELNQQQYLLLQHQYNQALNQKKQYNSLMQSNNLEQMAMLQQQHERENANLQQNQNILAQQVLEQQQIITDAINDYNTIVKNLVNYTSESPENYTLPTLSRNMKQIPLVVNESDSPNIYLNMNPSHNDSCNSLGTEHSSPNLNSLSNNNILPNQRKVASPTLSPPMSPVVNESYYDEGVYSVSGFSITSNNTSISEDIESVSILTDQLQQSIQRRPTFRRKPMSGKNHKIRIGGSDPDTFQATLNAYRQNVKNASDPALQFEYAKFLIESANDQYENGSTASSIQHKNDLFDEGFKFLKKLSNAGYPDAQHYLATCYNQDNDWDKAYPLFLQAAKHNHPIASYEIASFHESKRNYKKASQYYKKSASQGYPMAMHRLGMAALKGEMHMRKDVKNAIKWLKRAAIVANKENNGAASAYELSKIYENGIPPIVYPDELYSLELLVQAAELDYPPAQYKLGWCFEYGELGCPTDAVQSIHWFLLAAENDEPNAQFSLAGWYLTGAEGVIEPNDKEAFYWASKAADQEYVKAEYAVAYFYEMGIGIEKNMEEAMNWYKIAADHGDERAIKRLSTETDRSTEKSSSDCRIA